MDEEVVVNELHKRYPGKKIVRLPPSNPAEIICEVEPTAEHPEYSIALAVITSTASHYNDETETYEVLRSELELTLGDEILIMKPGDKQTIKPGTIHSAKGNQTWVKVTTKPGWTPAGHHPLKNT